MREADKYLFRRNISSLVANLVSLGMGYMAEKITTEELKEEKKIYEKEIKRIRKARDKWLEY